MEEKSELNRIEWQGDTAGDTIKALVKWFTGMTLGKFILNSALEEVKLNDIKIKKFIKELIEGGK